MIIAYSKWKNDRFLPVLVGWYTGSTFEQAMPILVLKMDSIVVKIK